MRNTTLIADLAQCGSPETLLAVILAHHPEWQAPVALEPFAGSVGVEAIGELAAGSAASALLTDLAKSKAVIHYSAALSAPRRRFAIAHQLGHFLLKTHRGDRQCSGRDLGEARRDTDHRKEEMQANRFAAGYLMPKPWFTAFVETLGKPSVAHLPVLARTYGVTIEAAASRYVDLTQAMCGFVFVKDGLVRLIRTSRSFPPMALAVSDVAPASLLAGAAEGRTDWVPAEARDWLSLQRDARPPKLLRQTLARANGVQIVMLTINAAAERRADEEEEKAALFNPKFGRPRTR
jgi:Zn-dependent peptidase ImmA (M78 family)